MQAGFFSHCKRNVLGYTDKWTGVIRRAAIARRCLQLLIVEEDLKAGSVVMNKIRLVENGTEKTAEIEAK
jgi:hypothetical protein